MTTQIASIDAKEVVSNEIRLCERLIVELVDRRVALDRASADLDRGLDWPEIAETLSVTCPTLLVEARCDRCHERLMFCACP